jgi:nitrate reductase NapE component
LIAGWTRESTEIGITILTATIAIAYVCHVGECFRQTRRPRSIHESHARPLWSSEVEKWAEGFARGNIERQFASNEPATRVKTDRLDSYRMGPSIGKVLLTAAIWLVVTTAISLGGFAFVTWLICLVFGWSFSAVFAWVAGFVVALAGLKAVWIFSPMLAMVSRR